jgi:TPR repeat protein
MLKDLACQGDSTAQCWLAHLYRKGHGTPQDYSQAEKWFRLAAEVGNIQAMLCLGNMFYFGRERIENYSEALSWYSKAAEKGNAEAEFRLAIMYSCGQGVPQNWSEAASWCLKAAEQGHPKAQYLIAKWYMDEKIVSEDPDDGLNWLIRAADSGIVDAQALLSIIFDGQFGIRKDDRKALMWLKKAAEGGDAMSQVFLGSRYADGERGVARDLKAAAMWYRKAAEQGDADAQHELGLACKSGEGVPKDDREAFRWFEKAAQQGQAQAQSDLGLAYLHGEGVQQDNALAFIWLDLAASNCDDTAQEERMRLLTRLSEDQIVQARERSLQMGLGPLEVAATKALHAHILKFTKKAEFEDPSMYTKTFMRAIIETACEKGAKVPIKKLFASILVCIRKMYEDEQLFVGPVLPPDELLMGIEGARYRDELYACQQKLSNPQEVSNAFSLCAFAAYNNFTMYLPPAALCKPDELEKPIATLSTNSPIIDHLSDPYNAVHSIVSPFLGEDNRRLGLFSKLTDQIFMNVHEASRSKLSNSSVTVDGFILPAHSDLPPRQLISTYLTGTHFLPLFSTPVEFPASLR